MNKLSSHFFILLLFVFFANGAFSQDILGRWVLEDIAMEAAKDATTKQKEALELIEVVLDILKSMKGNLDFDYKSDGTFTSNNKTKQPVEVKEGTWRIAGDKLFIKVKDDSEEKESTFVIQNKKMQLVSEKDGVKQTLIFIKQR